MLFPDPQVGRSFVQYALEEMGIRTNGIFKHKIACNLFANKWEFEQMGFCGSKSLRFDKNGKILAENVSNNALLDTKKRISQNGNRKIRCNFFANKWEFEQMGILIRNACRKIENRIPFLRERTVLSIESKTS